MLFDLPFIGVGLGGPENGGGDPGPDGAVQGTLIHGGDLGILNAVVGQGVPDDGLDLAAELLKKGGVAWVVANRHLPYEAELNAAFKRVRLVAEAGGYKLFEAVK